jgi:hypothetical protein
MRALREAANRLFRAGCNVEIAPGAPVPLSPGRWGGGGEKRGWPPKGDQLRVSPEGAVSSPA